MAGIDAEKCLAESVRQCVISNQRQDILHAAETDTQLESTGNLTVRSPRTRRAKAAVSGAP